MIIMGRISDVYIYVCMIYSIYANIINSYGLAKKKIQVFLLFRSYAFCNEYI